MTELRWGCHIRLEKYGRVSPELVATGRVHPLEVIEVDKNKPTFLGLATLWQRLIGNTAGSPFDATNAHIGVGNDSTPTIQTYQDLRGSSKVRRPMVSGYPRHTDSVSSLDAAKIWFQAAFGPGVAEFDWRECGIFNAAASNIMLNRAPVSFGVKPPGVTWTLTIILRLYGDEQGTVDFLPGEIPVFDPTTTALLPPGWNVITVPMAFGMPGTALSANFVADLPIRQTMNLSTVQLVGAKGANNNEACDLELTVYLTPYGDYPAFSYELGVISFSGSNKTLDDFGAIELYKGDVLRFKVTGTPTAETGSVAIEAIRRTDWSLIYGDDGEVPVITNIVAAIGTAASGAIVGIAVTTSERVNGTVFYGTTTAYGSSARLEPEMELSTTVILHLESGTTYHYLVEVVDAIGNRTRSADQTFTTP